MCFQWWKVNKYIYSSTMQEQNFVVRVLSILYHSILYTSTPLMHLLGTTFSSGRIEICFSSEYDGVCVTQ